MFDAFFTAVAWLLAWFYELPVVGGSFGWAITLLTLAVMLIVTPLTVKGTRSMMAMTALAPELKRIQQEYADDRERMNQEVLAFYRENKINPVGGCLPLVLQMPLFIVLYQVIYGMTRRGADGNFDPKYLDQFPDSELYQALHNSDRMLSWGLDLSRSAATALQDSFGAGFPYMLLILAVAGTAYLQQKQMSGRNPNVEMAPQQKILLRVLPLFLAVISFNFAAGLVIYFFVSNVYRIFQNAAISMKLYNISATTALLGIGANAAKNITGAPDAKPAAGGGRDRDNGRSDPKQSGSGSKPTPGKGSGSKGSGSKNAGSKSSNGGSPKGSKPGSGNRPPSGRVTPPKSSGGGAAATPPRRKKKRS
jgi:YidC/Oxa1 family membrane protein insertase